LSRGSTASGIDGQAAVTIQSAQFFADQFIILVTKNVSLKLPSSILFLKVSVAKRSPTAVQTNTFSGMHFCWKQDVLMTLFYRSYSLQSTAKEP